MKTILTTDRANQPFGYLQLDVVGSFIASQSISSSYSENSSTSSFALFAVSSSYETNIIISSSHSDTSDISISASYSTSSSYVPNLYPVDLSGYETTQNFGAYTASNDLTVSSLINSTSSYVLNSQTSSMTVLSASYATFALSASYETNIINSSSFSTSASYAQTSSYLIGYVPPTLVTSSISASWASSSLSSNAVSQSNLIGTSSLYSQTYILTGSYKEIITSSYTLTSTENGRLLIVNSGSIVTLTVPSTLPQGFACSMFQSGSGQVTVLGSGVNIRNRAGLSSSYAQYSVISLIQLDTNGNYLLGGDVG